MEVKASVPSLPTLSKILKKHFLQRFRRREPIKYKYRDPSFDEKRRWTCRLLAQFLHDGALIISVDESHFR